MKKRVLSVICSLALVLGMIVPWTGHVEAAAITETTCACGATGVTWETLTSSTTLTSGKHYRLTSDVATKQNQTVGSNFTVCIDLNGKKLSNTSGRVFLCGYDGGTNNVINIMDGSSAKTGQVVGGGGGSTMTAGVVYLYVGNTMNIYGGTFSCCAPDAVKHAGIFQVRAGATINMYDGKIIGGKANINGGAVNLEGGTPSKRAALNMYGGSIESGSAHAGKCVLAGTKSQVKLFGDASIEELFCVDAPKEVLTISGTYTGTLGVYGVSPIAVGSAIAVSSNADVSNAKISLVGKDTLAGVISGNYVLMERFADCDVCHQRVQWKSVNDAAMETLAAAGGQIAAGHYYLTEDVDVGRQVVMKKGGEICLDIAGHTFTHNRIMLGDGTVNQILNIQDSSAKKTGVVQARTSTGTAGSVFYLYGNTVLNLYGGTYQVPEGSAKYAGIMNIRSGAEVNVYGGKIIGCDVAEYGGAIDVWKNGVLNLAGGEIISGNATQYADCVCVDSGGIVSLSGDAYVEELYFAGSSADKLTVSGTFTGKANLAFKTAPTEGEDIGNCNNAVIDAESIFVANPRMSTVVSGNNLVAKTPTGVSLVKKDGTVSDFDTLEEALENRVAGSVIKLRKDNSESVSFTGDATIDLFGWDLSGDIDVSEGTLYLKDSATDDYTTNDFMGAGVVSGTITGNVEPCKNYSAIADENSTTYHKYLTQMKSVSLRPGAVAMYYTASIKMDEMLQAKMNRFGLAVSVKENPTADPADTTSEYTAYTDYTSSEARGALITAVMETTNNPEQNEVYAATDVYGRPYILYTDAAGEHYLYGTAYATNLKALTEKVEDTSWNNLKHIQSKALSEMYDAYKTEVKNWNLPSYAETAKASEDKSLKVLIIGNSHGLDSTHLLREVFKAEGYITAEQDVVLGALYIGGCRVGRHVENLTHNAAAYDYYKNDGSKEDGTWTIQNYTTMQYALEDEKWDVVLLQEMNTASAFPETSSEFVHNNDNIETVYTYVVKNLGYEPKLMWNMIWANPEIPEAYAEFAMKQTPGDKTYVEGIAPGSPEDPASQTWIFKDTMLGSRISWVHNYVNEWQNNRQTMYEKIVENLQDYILGNSALGFTENDVMPAATAVQYALTRCGMTEDGGTVTNGVAAPGMYRDYTHISDYARVMVAYLWYAKLTGKTEITDVNFTTVPSVLRATSKYKNLGDLTLSTDQIKAVKDSVNYALANPLAGSAIKP